jgi:ferrochelatase
LKKALVYLNLGTPEAPQAWPVSRYLRQFLMDPFVIDIPWIFRWLLVNLIIVPFRSRKSAHAYQQVWTADGSPLMVNSRKLVQKLDLYLKKNVSTDWDCFLAMRYGQPSIESIIKKVMAAGYNEIYLLPAYPQYALSSSETAFTEAERVIKAEGFAGVVYKLQDYYNEPGFVKAVAEKVAQVQKSFRPDHILFSYHGLPKRHLSVLHPECSFNNECCTKVWAENRNCYRHQSVMTTQALVKELGLKPEQFSLGFQSRLGTGWIEPFSDEIIEDLAKKNVKRLAVVSPSFTADCLETLEELAIRGDESFKAAGGESFMLVPCVNDSDLWVKEIALLLLDPSKMRLPG